MLCFIFIPVMLVCVLFFTSCLNVDTTVSGSSRDSDIGRNSLSCQGTEWSSLISSSSDIYQDVSSDTWSSLGESSEDQTDPGVSSDFYVYKNDFELQKINSPYGDMRFTLSNDTMHWKLKKEFDLPYNQYGTMFGPDDIFYIADDEESGVNSVSGNKMWRYNFNGRNNFCNTCGSETRTLSAKEAETGCLSVTNGAYADTIYNKGNGWSTWEVVSQDENSLCFNVKNSIANSLLGNSEVLEGHEIKLPYRCGENGTVGGNIRRRSDCDLAINYFQGVGSEYFNPGDTLTRRYYIYIPDETELPGITFKLSYSNFRHPESNQRKTKVVVLSIQRDVQLESKFKEYQFTGLKLQRNIWYYIEEVMVREGTVSDSSGVFMLYAGVAGEEGDKEPLVHETGYFYGNLVEYSFGGNWQHYNDASGFVYIDDFTIARGRVGDDYNR